jgi:hypothetical protein
MKVGSDAMPDAAGGEGGHVVYRYVILPSSNVGVCGGFLGPSP